MYQSDSTIQFIPYCILDSSSTAEQADTTEFSLDSVMAVIEHPETIEVPGMFHGIIPHAKSHDEVVRTTSSPSAWVFGALLLIIVMLTTYYHVRGISILNALKSMVNSRAMERNLRELNLNHAMKLAPIALLWSGCMAMIIYYYTHYGIHSVTETSDYLKGILDYAIIFAITTAFYYLRNGLIRIVGNTFEEGEATITYLTSNYLYTLIETTVAAPMLFFIYFSNGISHAIMIATIGIIAILYLARVVRGYKLFLTIAKTSKLHLFYYLCILEFGPLFIALMSLNLL